MHPRLLAVSLGLAACGAPKEAPPPEVPGRLDASIEAWNAEEEKARQPTRTVADAPPSETVRIAPPPAPKEPRSGKRVDVDLSGAPLGEALRFLADAAGKPIVLGRALDKPVSLHLRRADPLAALRALAATHGVVVESRNGVLYVQ